MKSSSEICMTDSSPLLSSKTGWERRVDKEILFFGKAPMIFALSDCHNPSNSFFDKLDHFKLQWCYYRRRGRNFTSSFFTVSSETVNDSVSSRNSFILSLSFWINLARAPELVFSSDSADLCTRDK